MNLLNCLTMACMALFCAEAFVPPQHKQVPSNNIVSTATSTTTALFTSTSDADFMASLRSRMDQVIEKDDTLPLVVLDSMLPRQVLNITINNPLLKELVRERLQAETFSFGMVGNAKLADGRSVTLSSGVEVEILGTPRVCDRGMLHLSLQGSRRFRVNDKTVETTEGGWTEAKVNFLNSTLDDQAELSNADPMSIARAMQMAREFTDPNFSLKESQSLVNMWLKLARKKERQPGQIDQLLLDLGPMPSWRQPTDCALWVGALINPIPALGVALEIRPQLLLAKTAEERTQIALDAIWNSIQLMQGAEGRFEQRKGV